MTYQAIVLLFFTFLTKAFSAQIICGGVEGGGGGGTLPAYPASPYVVKEVAESAKPKLLFLLNGYELLLDHSSEETNHRQSESRLYGKLFRGARNAQEVLKDLRLEVRMDRPCLTRDGTEVDASIYGSKPDTICLSAFRIAPKLDESMVEREILALLLHEVSHFLGADETEATQLQEEVARSITRPFFRLDQEKIQTELSSIPPKIVETIALINENSLFEASEKIFDVLTSAYMVKIQSPALPFSFFGTRESEYQDLLMLRLASSQSYLKTQIPGFDQEFDLARYQAQFRGGDFFLAKEGAFAGLDFNANHRYAKEKVFKIESLYQLKIFLEGMLKEYEVRLTHANQVLSDQPWLKLDGHLTQPSRNPWEDFIGTYPVQTVQCDSAGVKENEVEFQLVQKENVIFILSKYAMGMQETHISLGEFAHGMFLNSYGTTADGGVFFLEEGGGGWSRHFGTVAKSDLRLKINQDGSFEIVRIRSNLPTNTTQADSVQTCVFQGMFRSQKN